MKRVFPIFLLFGVAMGCASSKSGPSSKPAAGDVAIESAIFNTGSRSDNVTGRVVNLLDENSDGFYPKNEWLDVDSAPYRNKSLAIRYWYHGKQYMFVATGNQRVSYKLLQENAEHFTSSSHME